MSVLSIAFPAQAALPAAQSAVAAVATLARPLIGLGLVFALLMVFKPLLVGVLRAALLVVKPRQSIEERISRRTLRSVLMLNSMARELDGSQPALAAELRSLASRG